MFICIYCRAGKLDLTGVRVIAKGFTGKVIYLHTLSGHAGWLVKNLKLVPARSEGVVADEVLQGRLLQPAGAEGGAAVGVLKDGVAARCTFRREHCKKSQRETT